MSTGQSDVLLPSWMSASSSRMSTDVHSSEEAKTVGLSDFLKTNQEQNHDEEREVHDQLLQEISPPSASVTAKDDARDVNVTPQPYQSAPVNLLANSPQQILQTNETAVQPSQTPLESQTSIQSSTVASRNDIPQDLAYLMAEVVSLGPASADTQDDQSKSGITTASNESKGQHSAPRSASHTEAAKELTKMISSDGDGDGHSTADSECDSASDSDSDSSADTEQRSVPKKDNARSKKDLYAAADFSDDDENKMSPQDALRMATEHEQQPTPALPSIKRLPDSDVIEKIGVITSCLPKAVPPTIVIAAQSTGVDRVIDVDSIICFDDRLVLGLVADVFGSIQEPHYAIYFPTADAIPDGACPGRDVYHASATSNYVFTQAIRAIKGSDASNRYDEEPQQNELEWSDDEAERTYKRNRKAATRAKHPYDAADAEFEFSDDDDSMSQASVATAGPHSNRPNPLPYGEMSSTQRYSRDNASARGRGHSNQTFRGRGRGQPQTRSRPHAPSHSNRADQRQDIHAGQIHSLPPRPNSFSNAAPPPGDGLAYQNQLPVTENGQFISPYSSHPMMPMPFNLQQQNSQSSIPNPAGVAPPFVLNQQMTNAAMAAQLQMMQMLQVWQQSQPRPDGPAP